jgi:Putative sensor
MGTTDPVTPMIALTRAALREPFTRQARAELLFCLVGVLVGLAVLAVIVALLAPGTAESVIRAAVITAVLLPLALATGMARRLGAAHRRLAERLLGERIAPPPARPRRGSLGRLGMGLRDGPGWRALAYTLLKLPIVAAELYAVFLWAAGLANLTYPFWWGLFRNHPPDVRLSPVLVATPFPGRVLHVATYPGTFLAFAVGAAMVLVAPWVTRAVLAVDR